MGIDVSGVFQRRDAEKWVVICDYHDGRRGYLRSWLGFDRYREIPFSALRGVPEDFNPSEVVIIPGYRPVEIECFIGERGHSWISGEEILNTPALTQRSDEQAIAEAHEEISEFKKLVSSLMKEHGIVRFIYGFS